MDNERDSRIIWLFENDDSIESVSELANAFGMHSRDVYQVLKSAGYGANAADNRYYESSILHKIGIKKIHDGIRCAHCDILLLDNGVTPPDGWSRGINARVGDLCISCVREMKQEDRNRFNELVKIGCIVCLLEYGRYVKPEIHHIRRMGGHRDHKKTIPLCPEHHRTGNNGVARHAGLQEWELRHGSEKELLRQVNILCGE